MLPYAMDYTQWYNTNRYNFPREFGSCQPGVQYVFRSSALAPDAIPIPIKAMRVGRENPEIPVGYVRTIQVRWRRGYANIGIGGVAVLGRRGRRASRPFLTPELTLGAKVVVGIRVARRDEGRICVRAATIDDSENSAIRVVADLKIVLVNESEGAQTEAREIVSGFRPAGFAQFRSINEHEPDSEITFDFKIIPIDDSGHVALDAEANRSWAIHIRFLWRRWWWRRRGW